MIVLFLSRLNTNRYRRYELMIATKIKLSTPQELSIHWDNGHESLIHLQSLRDLCPCAGCQGETVLLRTYKPELKPDLPGKYNLVGIQQVGHYAIQVSWGDGHSTGIYTWEYLRNLCECSECSLRKE